MIDFLEAFDLELKESFIGYLKTNYLGIENGYNSNDFINNFNELKMPVIYLNKMYTKEENDKMKIKKIN